MTIGPCLVRLLHNSFYGPAWHGPAVVELLADVTAVQAAAPPAAGAHSIWQLVLHMQAWKDEVRRRLTGPGHKLTPAEDWPSPPVANDASWQAALDALGSSQQELEAAVAALDAAQLHAPTSPEALDREELLHVIIHHDLYHAGQIALLKAATRAAKN